MRPAFAFLCALLGASAPVRAAEGPLVYAAASLSDALTAAADSFAATGQPRPVLSFAGTGALARQIENGAPADLFFSADEQWMDYLAARGLIDAASRVALLGNRLVLVTPAAASRTIDIGAGFPLASLLAGGKLALADPDSVPAGRYARAALESLGVWRAVEGAVVRAENVRAALVFVARGEAAAGVVYATDAAAEPGVAVAGAFPAISHPPIVFPVALAGPNPSPAARAFHEFLRGQAAAAIFVQHGFTFGPRS
jgi:molybdate transport system substrate-binding protein